MPNNSGGGGIVERRHQRIHIVSSGSVRWSHVPSDLPLPDNATEIPEQYPQNGTSPQTWWEFPHIRPCGTVGNVERRRQYIHTVSSRAVQWDHVPLRYHSSPCMQNGYLQETVWQRYQHLDRIIFSGRDQQLASKILRAKILSIESTPMINFNPIPV